MPDIVGFYSIPYYNDDSNVPVPTEVYHYYMFAREDGIYLKDSDGNVLGPLLMLASTNIILPSNAKLNFGDPDTDGTWRIAVNGDNLEFSRREAGIYVVKLIVTA